MHVWRACCLPTTTTTTNFFFIRIVSFLLFLRLSLHLALTVHLMMPYTHIYIQLNSVLLLIRAMLWYHIFFLLFLSFVCLLSLVGCLICVITHTKKNISLITSKHRQNFVHRQSFRMCDWHNKGTFRDDCSPHRALLAISFHCFQIDSTKAFIHF